MREIDFVRGRPTANLARFALPALGANLLQSADQVVDMLVVGTFVGERGLAALANATMVGFVANSLSLGLAAGATVLVSRRLGAGDPRAASRSEGASLLAALALSAAVALPCALFAGPLYGALGVPADALADATVYTQIWAAGLPSAFLLSAAGAVMRAHGDAHTPMCLAVAVAAVNCAGGIALASALGVAGTAWSSTARARLRLGRPRRLGGRDRDIGVARPSERGAGRRALRRRPGRGGRGRALPARLLLRKQPRIRRHVRVRLLRSGDGSAATGGGERTARRRSRPRGARRPARARLRLSGHPRRPGALARVAVRHGGGVHATVRPRGASSPFSPVGPGGRLILCNTTRTKRLFRSSGVL